MMGAMVMGLFRYGRSAEDDRQLGIGQEGDGAARPEPQYWPVRFLPVFPSLTSGPTQVVMMPGPAGDRLSLGQPEFPVGVGSHADVLHHQPFEVLNVDGHGALVEVPL